eukprot:RCo005864
MGSLGVTAGSLLGVRGGAFLLGQPLSLVSVSLPPTYSVNRPSEGGALSLYSLRLCSVVWGGHFSLIAFKPRHSVFFLLGGNLAGVSYFVARREATFRPERAEQKAIPQPVGELTLFPYSYDQK